uniref:NADH dehydrogenase subunit 6 n=1 Tax=Sporochnus bolleanus TaxID=461143 RepID=UPI002E788C07|nr:NADH dehydrogenase subunit 6 [Sporochnus bolleanus]WBP70349.1 NADH dehydrogenase subunit 6 [Sporochnus bolleanus]
MKKWSTTFISSLVPFSLISYEDELKKSFRSDLITEIVLTNFDSIRGSSNKQLRKSVDELVDERLGMWDRICNSEGLTDFLRLCFHEESVQESYGVNNGWFVEFDSSCALNDPSYLLYSTHAILLIIAGLILLIAMVGAISLTLQKPSVESVYRQLGRESKNAVFGIKEDFINSEQLLASRNAEALS